MTSATLVRQPRHNFPKPRHPALALYPSLTACPNDARHQHANYQQGKSEQNGVVHWRSPFMPGVRIVNGRAGECELAHTVAVCRRRPLTGRSFRIPGVPRCRGNSTLRIPSGVRVNWGRHASCGGGPFSFRAGRAWINRSSIDTAHASEHIGHFW